MSSRSPKRPGIVVGLVLASLVAMPEAATPSRTVAERSESRSLPLPETLLFAENRGQATADVRFIARRGSRVVALTANDAILGVGGVAEARTIRLRFPGATDRPEITAIDEVPDALYLSPAHSNGPALPITQFQRVTYAGLYPGVDLTYYGSERQLEFDFVVQPYADPSVVRFALEGADALDILEGGDLSARVGDQSIRLRHPLVYQEHPGARTTITGRYALEATPNGVSVRFDLGPYDRALPLVIDPVVLHSNGDDSILGSEVNAAGQVYVLAETSDATGLSAQLAGTGSFLNPTCYLTKVNAQGTGVVYTLLFTDTIACSALAISPSGTLHFAGYEPPGASNLPVATVLSIDDRFGPPTLTRFQATNYNQLNSRIGSMAVDATGHVYLIGACRVVNTVAGHAGLLLNGFNAAGNAGATNPTAVCTTASHQAGAHIDQAVLTKLDRVGAFQFGTFLAADDAGGPIGRWGLAVDAIGRAYVSGLDSGSLTPTASAFRSTCESGGSCAYLMTIDTTQTGPDSLLYASYLWGIASLERQSVRFNGQSVYVAMDGAIDSDFPETAREPYPPLRGFEQPAGEGIELARFDLDTEGLPSQLGYAFQTTPGRPATADAPVFHNVHALNDLRVLPSGAVAVSSVFTDRATSPISHVGSLDVFYRSGQLRASQHSVELPSSLLQDAPSSKIAADANGRVYRARTTLQTPGVWDITVDSIAGLDPPGFGNTPPGVIVSGPLSAQALSPAGAVVPLTVSAFDAEDGWLEPACTHPLDVIFPVGVAHIICTATDFGGLSTSLTFDVTVTLVQNIGPNLTGIPIDLIDARTAIGPKSTFETTGKLTMTLLGAVDAPGTAYFQTRTDQTPPPPAGLQSGSSPYYYDVGINATMSAANRDIQVCVDFTGMSFARDLSTVRLYRLSGATANDWVDVTAAVDLTTRRICAIAHSAAELGTFALFTPSDELSRVTTLAGGAAAPLVGPEHVAFDLARDVMYIADRYRVLAMRLSDGTISTYAGGDPQAPFGGLQENVPATESGVFHVSNLAVDADGHLFLAEPENCIIRRIDYATKLIRTVAGRWTGHQTTSCGYTGDGGPAQNALLSRTFFIAFDAHGDLLVSQSLYRPQEFPGLTGGLIRKIVRSQVDGRISGRPEETITTIAGSGDYAPVRGVDPLSTGLYPSTSFALGHHNDLYAFAYFQLLRVRFDGGVQIVAGVGAAPSSEPFGGDDLHPLQATISSGGPIVVLPSGDVLIGDPNRQKLRRIMPGADGVVDGSPDERITTVAGFTVPVDYLTLDQLATEGYALSTIFPSTFGLTPDPRGGFVASDTSILRVRQFDLNLATDNNRPPVADAGLDQPETTSPVQLDGSASTDPDSDVLTFAWFEGTTLLGTGAQLSVPLSPGPHTITLQVADSRGATTIDTVGVLVLAADLAISASASATHVHALDTLQYSVTASNVGNVETDPTRVVVTLPAGMQFLGASPDPCAIRRNAVTCTLGALSAGASRAITMDVRVAFLGGFGTTFEVKSPVDESDLANNSATVLGSADLYVAERVGVADVRAVQASLMLAVFERIAVSESRVAERSLMLAVAERIGVADVAKPTIAPNDLAIDLLAPVAGARVFANVPATIRWQASGAPTRFDVELSTTSTQPFQPIASCSNLPATATSCEWLPPSINHRDARVRIIARGVFNTAMATSGPFTITAAAPAITITRPSNETHWAIGTKRTITWTHNLGVNSFVRIELSRDSGGSWETLSTSVANDTATQGHFEWVVTGPPTTRALFKVSWTTGPVFALPNSTVDIETPSLTLIMPDGNEKWFVDSIRTISWAHNLGADEAVSIHVSRDGGSTWTAIAASVTNSSESRGTFSWVVTPPTSLRSMVRVRWRHFVAHGSALADVSDSYFVITSNIHVLEPTFWTFGWAAGSQQTVKWMHNYGSDQMFDVEASTDGGASWSYVAQNVPARSATEGSAFVRMPGVVTEKALVRVSPSGRPAEGNTSDGLFTLEAPRIFAPNVGKVWQIGSRQRIYFGGNIGTSTTGFGIAWSVDGGVTWRGITGGPYLRYDSGERRFYVDWTVQGPPTTHARIQVNWSGGGVSAVDMSDADFSIASGIDVKPPNTPLPWAAGSQRSVHWTHIYHAGQRFDVDVSTDGGGSWTSVAQNVSASSATEGSAFVRMPGVVTTQALVRVSPSGRPADGDTSDEPFTLEAPRVFAPNVGTRWRIGSRQRIYFGGNVGTSTSGFGIAWSVDGGMTWRGITGGPYLRYDSGERRFYVDWTVQAPPTDHARIRVSWVGGGVSAVDVSDADFSIIPGIHVTSPNSGGNWVIGSTRTITWTHIYGQSGAFDVAFSPDDGATWLLLVAGVSAADATTGSYSWTVNAAPTTSGLIRVSPRNRAADGDTSDSTFTIPPPRVRP